MNDSNSQLQKQPPVKRRNTRTALEKMDERKSILADLAEGKNPREIRYRLNLTKDQYSRHITAALDADELSQQPKDVSYAVIRFGALQREDRTELRKRLQWDINDWDLLKFEQRNNEIICSIIDAENNLSN